MMFFLNTVCSGITFIDSTKISVCHGKRIKRNKVFDGIAKLGKSTMGWFYFIHSAAHLCPEWGTVQAKYKYGFKLHLICNDTGELLSFCLTPANVDDRNPGILKHLTKKLFGKLFGDKGYTRTFLRTSGQAYPVQVFQHRYSKRFSTTEFT
jgi:hypothetical protein